MLNHIKILIAVLLFNAISAMGGGLALMADAAIPPIEWLKNTPFDTYFVPGLMLFLVVGVTSLIAALSLMLKIKEGMVVALFAGIIMVGWIVGEILVIRQFSWLQPIYFLTGLYELAAAYFFMSHQQSYHI